MLLCTHCLRVDFIVVLILSSLILFYCFQIIHRFNFNSFRISIILIFLHYSHFKGHKHTLLNSKFNRLKFIIKTLQFRQLMTPLNMLFIYFFIMSKFFYLLYRKKIRLLQFDKLFKENKYLVILII